MGSSVDPPGSGILSASTCFEAKGQSWLFSRLVGNQDFGLFLYLRCRGARAARAQPWCLQRKKVRRKQMPANRRKTKKVRRKKEEEEEDEEKGGEEEVEGKEE